MPKENDVIALVLFVTLLLAASLHGLAVSGHFPRSNKASTPAPDIGPIVLFGSMAVTIASVATGIAAALRLIPWYAAIIGGGLAILVAPLVLQWFPDRFVDGRGAPVALAAAGAVVAVVLILLATRA
jgi:hypothetical protein